MDNIKIIFDSSEDEMNLQSGSISQISWYSLKPFLYEAFGARPHENIVGIIVSKDGIQAKFK